MTINTEDPRIVQYAGAGSTGPYSIPFDIDANDELIVVRSNATTGVETTLALTTDYTVATTLDTLTLVTALAAGTTLTIKGSTPNTQESDFTDYSTFPPETLEAALDKLTKVINETKETVGRGITLPISTTITNAEATGGGAGKYLRINEDGDGVEFVTATITPFDIVNDTTPQLGGNLDCNGSDILIDSGDSIKDDAGNEQIIFSKTASAVNEFTVTNAATGAGATIAATGGDTNIDFNIQAKGTGAVNLRGTATSAAEVRLFEDTDNGTNYVGIKAPTSLGSSVTFTLPSDDGTSGQCLVTNASGTLSFADNTAPGMIWISTTSASASATVDIDLPTGYTYYKLMVIGLRPATDAVDLYTRFRTTGGAIRSGASDYRYANIGTDEGGGPTRETSAGAAQITLNYTATGIDTGDSGNSLNGDLVIFNARNASLKTFLNGRVCLADTQLTQVIVAGHVATAESNDRIQLLASSGNIDSGTFILYGFKEA